MWTRLNTRDFYQLVFRVLYLCGAHFSIHRFSIRLNGRTKPITIKLNSFGPTFKIHGPKQFEYTQKYHPHKQYHVNFNYRSGSYPLSHCVYWYFVDQKYTSETSSAYLPTMHIVHLKWNIIIMWNIVCGERIFGEIVWTMDKKKQEDTMKSPIWTWFKWHWQWGNNSKIELIASHTSRAHQTTCHNHIITYDSYYLIRLVLKLEWVYCGGEHPTNMTNQTIRTNSKATITLLLALLCWFFFSIISFKITLTLCPAIILVLHRYFRSCVRQLFFINLICISMLKLRHKYSHIANSRQPQYVIWTDLNIPHSNSSSAEPESEETEIEKLCKHNNLNVGLTSN